jgi:hypothetical protein
MSYTLFDASLDLSRVITTMREGTASSNGTTATLIDSSMGTDYPNDYWNDGTIWVPTRGAVAAQFKRITDYVASSYTLTFDALTTSITSGNSYRIANKEFPLYILIQKINAALRALGPMPTATTISAVADLVEYTNSQNSIFDEEIIAVEVGTDTSTPYGWTPHYHWKQVMESTKKFIFDWGYELADASPMRVTYLAPHSDISMETAVINTQVHPERLRWASALECWRWKEKQQHANDPGIKEMLVESQQLAQIEASRHPINKQKIRLARW